MSDLPQHNATPQTMALTKVVAERGGGYRTLALGPKTKRECKIDGQDYINKNPSADMAAPSAEYEKIAGTQRSLFDGSLVQWLPIRRLPPFSD